jgi:hypothetical protein
MLDLTEYLNMTVEQIADEIKIIVEVSGVSNTGTLLLVQYSRTMTNFPSHRGAFLLRIV